MIRRAHAVWVLVAILAAAVPASGQPSESMVGADVLLAEAKRTFDALDYEQAVAGLDRVISAVEARRPLDEPRRQLLTEAYELRARARFNLSDRDGARTDFTALITLDPGHTLPNQVSPTVAGFFADLKNALVGVVNLTVDPADADVQIDGITAPIGAVSVLAGAHTVLARKPGYRQDEQPFSVAAHATVDLLLRLERVSSTVSVITVPFDVEVVVDGVPRGLTAAGPPPAEFLEAIAALGVPAATASKPFVLADVLPGSHLVQLSKACYGRVEQRIDVQKPDDYRLPPVKLVKTVGAVGIDAAQVGSVFLDGQNRGPSPMTIDDVCEGSHIVEVRSPSGRFLRRIDVRVGDKLSLHADLRPAVAILSVSGLPEGLRGAPDLRLAVERALQSVRTLTFFSPPSDQADRALAQEKLPAGWLSFDTVLRPIGDAAAGLTASARQDVSTRLTRALDVQGVAAVTVPPNDRATVLVTMLAAGSGEADAISINLNDPSSVSSAAAAINAAPVLFRSSIGLETIDVVDVPGSVVIAVDPGGTSAKAGLAAGDVILKANGQAIADSVSLATVLAGSRVDDALVLELRGQHGATRAAEVRVARVPQAISMVDQTVLFNTLILELRSRLAGSLDPLEESVTRLNLGVALMRVGSWAEAYAELQKVRLPDGPGVANATVQYLSGLCSEALGRLSDAESSWRAAATSSDSLLTADGPAVKDLAERKLANLAGRVRRPDH